MLRKIASFISYLSHPLWLPSISSILILYFWPPQKNVPTLFLLPDNAYPNYLILTYVILSTAIIPLLIFYYMQKNNKINSIRMHNAKERLLPSLILIGIHIVNIILFLSLIKAPLLAFVSLVAVFIISISYISIKFFNFKISLHTSSITAFTTAIFVLYQLHISTLPFLLVMIALSIAVGFARRLLKAHSLTQIFAGYALGILSIVLYL